MLKLQLFEHDENQQHDELQRHNGHQLVTTW
jgi:hypothetical protein